MNPPYSTHDTARARRQRQVREATGLSDAEAVSVLATIAFLSGWDDATTDAICRLFAAVRRAERERAA